MLSVAFPVSFNRLLFFPFALIGNWTVPAPPTVVAFPALALAAFTPLPDSASVPGPGTFTGSTAVPFFALRASLPKLNALEGLVATSALKPSSSSEAKGENVCVSPFASGGGPQDPNLEPRPEELLNPIEADGSDRSIPIC